MLAVVVGGVLVAVVVVVVIASGMFRLGLRAGLAIRRQSRSGPRAESLPVADLPMTTERLRLIRARQQRLTKRPWNYHRPGLTEEQRAQLEYELESGKLDEAIDAIVREEQRKAEKS